MIAPRSMLHGAALAAGEAALNRVLALDPAALQLLMPLQGQVFHFAVRDLGLDLFLLPGISRLQLLGSWDGPVTAVLRGDSTEFVALLRASDPAAQLINSRLSLEGDSRALIQLQHVLGELEPDWEAPLAALLGDVAAHSLGRNLRGGWRWLRSSAAAMARQSNDYWREESGQLVPREAWEEFATAVDECRRTGDRLAARLARLRQQRQNRSSMP